jgi:hypothetical protein
MLINQYQWLLTLCEITASSSDYIWLLENPFVLHPLFFPNQKSQKWLANVISGGYHHSYDTMRLN